MTTPQEYPQQTGQSQPVSFPSQASQAPQTGHSQPVGYTPESGQPAGYPPHIGQHPQAPYPPHPMTAAPVKAASKKDPISIILTAISMVFYVVALIYIIWRYANATSFFLLATGLVVAVIGLAVSAKKQGKPCVGALVATGIGIISMLAQVVWVISVFLFGNPGIYMGTNSDYNRTETVEIQELSTDKAAENTQISPYFVENRCFELDMPGEMFVYVPEGKTECTLIVQLGDDGDRHDMLLSAIIEPVPTGEDLETAWEHFQKQPEVAKGEIKAERFETASGQKAIRVDFPYSPVFMVPTSVYFIEVDQPKFAYKGTEVKLFSIAAPTKLNNPEIPDMMFAELLANNFHPK
ncbi:MAG: hypothetical protein Q4D73_04010 [Actinomycetaceae bacterium]|nr:hypothetical protein [Actinomycetaceae bacterium]